MHPVSRNVDNEIDKMQSLKVIYEFLPLMKLLQSRT